MISLYRWQPGQSHGTWIEHPELPAGGQIPASEVWWLDLADPSPEEEALAFDKFLKVHALTLEDATRPRRESDHAAHLPKVEEFPDYLFVIASPRVVRESGRGGQSVLSSRFSNSAVLTHQVLITHHYQPLPRSRSASSSSTGTRAGWPRTGLPVSPHPDEIVDGFAPAIDRIVDRSKKSKSGCSRPHPASCSPT